ncbi:MAG TPA: hypothetical protein VM657_08420 [Sphingomonas sp.]|nr:hypothetical protein [Sphingomonas sp.]
MITIGLGSSLVRGASPRAGFDFTAGTMPPGARLTRASIGSRFDTAGVMRIEAADVPRFDHDPATGALRGLLIEPQRTNDVTRSTAPDSAAWARSGGIAITAGAIAAPDGASVAAVVADTNEAYNSVSQIFGELASRTLSVFVAKDNVSRASRFPILRASAGTSDLAIDTATGSWSISGAAFAGEVRDHGTYWRIALQFATCDRVTLYPAVGAGPGWSNAPGTTGSVTVWGFQAEQGAGATSYIPTDAAAANRAADVLSLDWRRWGAADGPIRLRYIFDDGSVQESTAEVIDGATTVPTDLARSWLRRVERR